MRDTKFIYFGGCLYLLEDVSFDQDGHKTLDFIVSKYERIAAIFSNSLGRKVELSEITAETPLKLFEGVECTVRPYRIGNINERIALNMPNVAYGCNGDELWQFLEVYFEPHEITNMCI